MAAADLGLKMSRLRLLLRQLLFIVSKFMVDSNEIFELQFFQNANLPGPLTNGLKYSRFLLRIR